jgi:large subunit ribosomal protein L5
MADTETKATKPAKTVSSARLKALYNDKIVKELVKELKLQNINEVPRLEKIVVNSGLGRAKDDKRLMEIATLTLTKITGQAPVQTTAKQSIASFKLREGNKIGLKVTLRDQRMYEFLDRLVNIVMPRLRDFHGVSNKAFDKQGNYSVGISDQTVFPELTFEDTPITHGLQVVCVVNAKEPAHAKALLEKLGMPFEKVKEDSKEKETN